MAIGVYDYDLLLNRKKLFLNLEAMKIASYYNKKKENIVLVDNCKRANDFEEFFVFRNTMPRNSRNTEDRTPKFYPGENIKHVGLAYSGGIYLPMEKKFEIENPFPYLYSDFFRKKLDSKELSFLQIEKILNSHFIRLRAGDHELDLFKLTRKESAYLYDYKIEQVTDWYEKLKYIRENLVKDAKLQKFKIQNGFEFTSFENIKKLSKIQGFKSDDVNLIYPCSYKEFKDQFIEIAPWVSSRDGIRYHYGDNINSLNDSEIVNDLCLAINKYFFTKSIGKACSFIVSENCENSHLNKLQKSFQYWTDLRIADKTFIEYAKDRHRGNFEELYSFISSTPYKKQFDRLSNITKNEVKHSGWYYHV